MFMTHAYDARIHIHPYKHACKHAHTPSYALIAHTHTATHTHRHTYTHGHRSVQTFTQAHTCVTDYRHRARATHAHIAQTRLYTQAHRPSYRCIVAQTGRHMHRHRLHRHRHHMHRLTHTPVSGRLRARTLIRRTSDPLIHARTLTLHTARETL